MKKKILLDHNQRYPEMQIQDMIKLLYQAEFGPAHMFVEEHKSLKSIKDEVSNLKGYYAKSKLFENISDSFSRLDLYKAKQAGLLYETINKLFVQTVKHKIGTLKGFEQSVLVFIEMCRKGMLPFSAAEVERYIEQYKQGGCGPVSHSEKYKELYKPCYRLVLSYFEKYIEIFMQIDKLSQNSKHINVAIEGSCASGKTTLALLLQNVYDCNVFHMDDFFLQPSQRTKERFEEPGGNIDYERFYGVISNLEKGKAFTYEKFLCAEERFSKPVSVSPKQLNIIEGVYSMHPKYIDFMDLSVFLRIDEKKQKERLKNRNTDILYKRFIEEWIPLENRYFNSLSIETQCDIVIDA